MLITLILAIQAIAAPVDGGNGTSPTPPTALISADTRAYFDTFLKRWDIPGLSLVAIAGPQFTKKTSADGWVTEYYNYGVANAAGDKVTEDTLFPIASNTKLFTAISVGTVLAQHNLTWSTKVKDVLPEWKLMDEYASTHADIVDLTSMRSGMPGHPMAQFKGDSDAQVVANLGNLPPSAEIRQVYQYNNMHYASLAHVVTTVSGTPFVDWVNQNILTPLNMTTSTFDYTGVTTESFRRTGVNGTQGALSPDLEHLDPACFGTQDSIGWWTNQPYKKGVAAGEAGMILNARDLAKWFRELLNPIIINPMVLNAVTTPVMVADAAGMGLGIQAYGAGQVMTTIFGESLIMHTGSLPGQSSLFLRLPDRGVALGIMANEELYSPLFLQMAMALRVASDVLGLPTVDIEQELASSLRFSLLFPPPSPPAVPAPVPEGTQVVGTYSHPGYGSFTLRPMPVGPETPAEVGIAAALARLGLPTTDVLYAPLDGWFDTHITFTHWDGAGFNVTFFDVAERDGKVIVPDAGQSYQGIVTPQGVGMFGNFWGAGQGVPTREATTADVQQAAEVFFTRT
ncbi:hypothetical protein CspHIS471_0100190 [Cutaneotrichosporon sp. HIS471]|nr:hypothetical protein CspHIS471_0100190 [Cutaneotrichosporon sp. HIS471]